jgi:hypothetical protein
MMKGERKFLKENNYQHVKVELDIAPNSKAFFDAYARLCKYDSLEDYLRDHLIDVLNTICYNDAERNNEINKAMNRWNLEPSGNHTKTVDKASA